MINAKKYINFINGRYVNEGIRITAGILLPSFLMNYFDMLPVGLALSLGALCVSVADTPGVVKHRINGMLACCLLVSAISVIVYYATANAVLLGFVLLAGGFFFSMLTVYGNRSTSVGIAALLIMVLSLQTSITGKAIWINAGYTLIGGVWYMLYSILLYRLRPYKFIQQVLADYISSIAAYLSLRGNFYALQPDYDKINEQLLKQQINVEAQQNMLSDLLFNARSIVKESTQTGRVLIKTYLEVAEIYESVMTTYQHYPLLHEQFDNTGILEEFQEIILLLAKEMEEISMSVKTGIASAPNNNLDKLAGNARQEFEALRKNFMNDENVENFIGLGRIMKNLEDLAAKIKRLHLYSTDESTIVKEEIDPKTYHRLLPSDDIRPSLFFNNLNFKSNIFRHALRVSLALLVGYCISLFFKVDHGYWILLTIIVILKPAYALTKTRNKDRLIGTLAGIIIGMLILFFIKNNSVLLVLMIFFMAGSYMFIRTNYFLTVLLMTPYLFLLFHLLFPGNIIELMQDRVIDTAIGSAIAFFASLFLVPAWERSSIKSYMLKMLHANEKYYSILAAHFYNPVKIEPGEITIARREVLIAMANLSDAFNRMLSEPKRYRQGVKNVHRFVVINHTLTAHLATLAYLLQTGLNKFRSPQLMPLVQNTQLYFKNAIHVLSLQPEKMQEPDLDSLKILNEQVDALVEKRKMEIANGQLETPAKKELVETKSVTDQFNYIFSDAAIIYKISMEHDNEMMNAK